MRKVPPLQKRPFHALFSLLITALCLFVFWLFAGMPSIDPARLARENEQISLLEPGTVLTTVMQDDYAYTLVRGTDGAVRYSEVRRYEYLPFLYESRGSGMLECENLDGAAYFAEPNYVAEYAYLAVADERVDKVVMDVAFTMDNREHAQTMYGVLMENGVFRLDLNEMLNLAQGRVYDSGDRLTYDRTLYWFAFPGNAGLAAFDAYEIRAYDAAGDLIQSWCSSIE